MEVFYKFKSAKDFVSLPIDWHYTTVSDVKQLNFNKKCSGKRTKFDKLILTNAQTNQDYLDGETLIPANTSLIVRRAPYCSCLPIVFTPAAADQENKLLAGNKLNKDVVVAKNYIDQPSIPQESEWEDFIDCLWNYLSPPQIVVPVQDTTDEDSKIRALNTNFAGFGHGGMGGTSGGGREGLLERRMTPPSSYICHRCKVPGHFIQHCPTNGDPKFHVKRTKPPTGIPHSMLMAASDGSYALPNGHIAVLKPNEAAFEKEIQGIPSTHSFTDLPAELYCPVCRAVMKDAVLTSKCCFNSYCDKCIRDYFISNSMCICGATNVLADDLLPNKTLRGTIVRFLESSNCRGANVSGASQPQVMESAQCLQLKIPTSSTLSAASQGVVVAPKSEGNPKVEEMKEPAEVHNIRPKTLGEANVGNGEEVSEAVDGCAREPGSEMCHQVTDEEMPQKLVSGDLGKKKKKLAYMQSRPDQDFAAENYLMPRETSNFSPHWNGMQPTFDGFGRPYGGQMPFMGYGPGLIPFGGAFYPVPFGAQASMMPIPPHKDLAEYETGFNGCIGPPIMSREESEALKTTMKQNQDIERSGGNVEVCRDRNSCRDMISEEEFPSVKSKFMSITPPERSTHDPELARTSSKRKAKYGNDYYEEHTHQPPKKVRMHHHQSESVSATRTSNTVDLPPSPFQTSTVKTLSDRKNKASVLARMTFPEGESTVFKKRKLGSSPTISHQRSHSMRSNKYHEAHRKTAAAVFKDSSDNESSDNDRHFKRRPSTYESSPTPAVKDGKHSYRGWREKGVMAASIGRLSVY